MRSSVFWLKRLTVHFRVAVEIVVLLTSWRAVGNAECCGSSCFSVGDVSAECLRTFHGGTFAGDGQSRAAGEGDKFTIYGDYDAAPRGIEKIATHVSKDAEEITERALHTNQSVEVLQDMDKMNALLDSSIYVRREKAKGYVDVLSFLSALGAQITARSEALERQITEELSEELKRKCAVTPSGRASSESRKAQKPSEQLSAESLIETRMKWFAKEMPPSQASSELFQFLQKKQGETQVQEKTQAFADAMADPAKRGQYMTEWNGLYGEFGEFTRFFDEYAELSPLPKSEEGGGGIAKQMYHRKFTQEGSKAVVEYFKGKVPPLSPLLLFVRCSSKPQRNRSGLRKMSKCRRVRQVSVLPLLPRMWSAVPLVRGLPTSLRSLTGVSLPIFIHSSLMKITRRRLVRRLTA